MCDTLVAMGNSTKDGPVLFAKNSNRDPFKARFLQINPSAKHKTDEQYKYTSIENPQVSQLSVHGNLRWLTSTAALCAFIFKPIWMERGTPDEIGYQHELVMKLRKRYRSLIQ